jgi:hypothetical protein
MTTLPPWTDEKAFEYVPTDHPDGAAVEVRKAFRVLVDGEPVGVVWEAVAEGRARWWHGDGPGGAIRRQTSRYHAARRLHEAIS